jgi:hypothetical protein
LVAKATIDRSSIPQGEGETMKKIFKKWMMALIISTILFIIGTAVTSAQPFATFTGKVVAIQRGAINVEGGKGEVIQFAVGRKTVYNPPRELGLGEWVKVEYRFDGSRNVGYQVQVIPPPSHKKK